MRFVVGHVTDVGRIRQGNEDAYLISPTLQLFAVADGMGGHRAGEVASHAALGSLLDVIKDDPALSLTEAVGLANDAVYQKAVADPTLQGMGTTLTAVRMDGGAALLGHVGDSRAYLLRDGELLRITEDHSFVDQLRREGRITEEQAATHPQRSILTRALGIEPGVLVDPGQVDLLDGDRLLLCSDGLHALVRDPVILDILRREAEPQTAAEALIAAANAAGGDDNITAVVIDVHDDEGEGHARAVAASATVEPTAESTVDGATVDLPPVEMLPIVGPELDLGAPAAVAAPPVGEGPDAEALADGDGAVDATEPATAPAAATRSGPGATTVDIDEQPGERAAGLAAASAARAKDGTGPKGTKGSRKWLIPVVVVAATVGAIVAVVVATNDDDSPSNSTLTTGSAPVSADDTSTTTRRAADTSTSVASRSQGSQGSQGSTATTTPAITTPATGASATTASPASTTGG